MFRWSIILTGCVIASIALLRVQARQSFHEHQARAFAEAERFVAERRKVVGPAEQAWLNKYARYNAERRREYEHASRWPWRSVKERPASREGDD